MRLGTSLEKCSFIDIICFEKEFVISRNECKHISV